jgi:GNAT superfamily N-acetyltransferase
MIRVTRITQLQAGIQRLRDEADRDGVRNMGLLVDQWESGAERFDAPGEALFGAFDGDALIGVGGVTIEHGADAMRMRRLYVLHDWRKRGAGRALAQLMMATGLESADFLTCNARATPAAAKFWEAMGFAPVTAPGWTHIFTRSTPA